LSELRFGLIHCHHVRLAKGIESEKRVPGKCRWGGGGVSRERSHDVPLSPRCVFT
jgi:hypothetical protein